VEAEMSEKTKEQNDERERVASHFNRKVQDRIVI
jgi:hypothetical protein